jgi:DNA-binding transcriptional LysR family regulator
MDLRQLRYLVALADEEHFTRAAEREHVSQPALSQQIRRLEDEVGLTLVDRTTRRVHLTEPGRMLVGRARRILAEIEAAEAELGALKGVQTGHLTIGATSTLGPVDLSLLLATFHGAHPGVELTVREAGSGELAAMVREDEVDIAFLSVTERMEREELTLHRLFEEELMAVLPPGHRLAGADEIAMAELRGERFVAFREGTRLRELLHEAAAEAGFVPRVAFESDAVGRMRDLVERGLGVAVLPRSDATAVMDVLGVARIVEPALARDVTLAWRSGRRLSPAAQAFADLTLGRHTA